MKKIGTKIGLGIVTNDRQEFYEEVMDTSPLESLDTVYVFDSSHPDEKYVDPIFDISGDSPATVGVAKNRLMQKMYEDGIDHIFLQEHDVKIVDPSVFEAYIETAKTSGIWGTLCYAWHGDGNIDHLGRPRKKYELDLGGGLGVDFTHNGVAPFSYIHRNVVRACGYHDEYYQNCWEHLDYFQNQSKMGLASHWRWFTDMKDSHNFIEEIDGGGHKGSVIRRDQSWADNMKKGQEYFRNKWGYNPTMMPEVGVDVVESRMNFLIDKYGV